MAETEDLKSFQCRFESDWGHHLVRKYSHIAALLSTISINNAYTNAYTFARRIFS